MIFNEMNTNTAVSYEAVQESPYELGIGGALMHVYENECNYNALMKAAALSEMKYYNENGGDLFVQEAGAFKGFIEKAKEFFKKVIEKIKSIGKKFMAVINQYRLKDSDFIKKYETDLKRRENELKDFKFNGYKFSLDVKKEFKVSTDNTSAITSESNQDDVNNLIEKNRGDILGGDPLTEADFRKALTDTFYGDKEEFPVNIHECLKHIKDTKDDVKRANDLQKAIIDKIDTFIKNLESAIKMHTEAIDKNLKAGGKMSDADNTRRDDHNNIFKKRIDVWKALSNDFTVYYGAFTKALAARNRQAKAICVKALSYKHESATVAESGTYGDIFAGVEII